MPPPTTLCPLGCETDAALELVAPAFSLWRCVACGLVRTEPPPDQKALVETYDGTTYLNLAATEEGMKRRCEDRLAVIGPHIPRGKLLDVGAGGGTFLSVAKAGGYEVRGVDLSPRWARYALEEHGVKVMVGDLQALDLTGWRYDVVTLWHVLEHLPQPVETLRRLGGILTEGGRLVVEVPNFGAPSVQLKCRWLALTRHAGNRWRHLNPWEHSWHFEPASLRACLNRAGFRPVLLRTMSGNCNTGGGPLFHRLLQATHAGARLLCVAEAV